MPEAGLSDKVRASDELLQSVREQAQAGRTKVALFLGAGASQHLGKPTMNGFFEAWFGDDFGDRLQGPLPIRDSEDLVLSLIRAAYPDPRSSVFDLEHVIGLLQVGTDCFEEPLGTLGIQTVFETCLGGRAPPYAQFGQRFEQLSPRWADFGRLLADARELMFRKLHDVFGPVDVRKATALWNGQTPWLTRAGALPVFTTNYDRVMEVVCGEYAFGGGPEPVDGFVQSGGGAWVWDPDAFLGAETEDLILFKLHGSVHWFLRNGELRRGAHDEWETRGGLGDDAMLLPAIGKLREGWSSELYQFLDAWANCTPVWVVIGFSFRDEEIREIFRRHLTAGDIESCIVVAPVEDDDERSNAYVHTLGMEYPDTVTRVDARFGDDDCTKRLAELVS